MTDLFAGPTANPMPTSLLILRPKLGYTWPIIVVAAGVAAIGVWFLAGGIRYGEVRALAVGITTLLGALLPLAMWYLRGKLFVDATTVGKTDWLGRTITCPKAEVAELRTAYLPQPTILVVLRDGQVGMRFNRRWWTKEQLTALETALKNRST